MFMSMIFPIYNNNNIYSLQANIYQQDDIQLINIKLVGKTNIMKIMKNKNNIKYSPKLQTTNFQNIKCNVL